MTTLPILHRFVDRYDTPELTVGQAKEIIKAAQRIITGNTRCDEITPVDGMGIPGCYKWKPSREMRHTCDCEIRMVFRYVGNTIEIVAASQRENVYSKARARVRQFATT